jgi:hypothetical protein
MNDDTPTTEQEAPQATILPESYILVTFAAPGSSEIGVVIKASPVQIFGAIGILHAQAEAMMFAQPDPRSQLEIAQSIPGMLRDHGRKRN